MIIRDKYQAKLSIVCSCVVFIISRATVLTEPDYYNVTFRLPWSTIRISLFACAPSHTRYTEAKIHDRLSGDASFDWILREGLEVNFGKRFYSSRRVFLFLFLFLFFYTLFYTLFCYQIGGYFLFIAKQGN